MKLKCCDLKYKKIKLKETVVFLKIVSDENRLNILCILKNKELCVNDIWQYLDLSQNLVSHHLKVLKDFGLVQSKKDGVKVIYSLKLKNIDKYKSLFNMFL